MKLILCMCFRKSNSNLKKRPKIVDDNIPACNMAIYLLYIDEGCQENKDKNARTKKKDNFDDNKKKLLLYVIV